MELGRRWAEGAFVETHARDRPREWTRAVELRDAASSTRRHFFYRICTAATIRPTAIRFAAENLSDAIANWHGSPSSPPPPSSVPGRPVIEMHSEPLAARALQARLVEPDLDSLQSVLLSVDPTLQGIVAGRIPPLKPSQVRNPSVGIVQDALARIAAADSQSGVFLLLDAAQRGYFGPKTTAAVRGFQIVNGLVPDMLVGKNTLLALDRALIGVPSPTEAEPVALRALPVFSHGRAGVSQWHRRLRVH